MPEIGTLGLMSGDGKRGAGHWPQATAPILDFTELTVRGTAAISVSYWRDFCRASEAADMPLHDPNVWTGGALQEKSVKLECSGLAPMYPAFGWSSCAPGHHGYKRAFDLISGQASSGLFGSPVLECAGKTVAPSLPFSLADLGGELVLGWHDHASPLTSISLFDRAAGFLPPRPQDAEAGARRGCQGWPGSGPPEGLGLDSIEHGASAHAGWDGRF